MEDSDGWAFTLTLSDYTLILNALHYYKKVDKRGNFAEFDDEAINQLRDKLAEQLVWDNTGLNKFIPKPS
jgi:non-homologous end joining protein Ku